MKLIKPSFEILEQAPGIQGVKKQIELAGRTCYKSEDKITDTSCEEFVNRMVNSGHGAMLEHGTVYLNIPCKLSYNDYGDIEWIVTKGRVSHEDYEENKYTKLNLVKQHRYAVDANLYVTTNYRVMVENGWLDDLQYQCEPTEYHEKRITVKFICDRGVSHEFVRHRVFSFAQESTRYCNYSRTKYGSELTFIIPSWMDTIIDQSQYSYDTHIEEWQRSEDANTSNFLQSLAWSEKNYLTLLRNGWTAQQARSVLPNALKTELVMTGFLSDWEHFFKLRCHSTAHPDARALAIPLQEEFIKKGFIYGESV
jgi:thymidylate synthase (FAD)